RLGRECRLPDGCKALVDVGTRADETADPDSELKQSLEPAGIVETHLAEKGPGAVPGAASESALPARDEVDAFRAEDPGHSQTRFEEFPEIHPRANGQHWREDGRIDRSASARASANGPICALAFSMGWTETSPVPAARLQASAISRSVWVDASAAWKIDPAGARSTRRT